MYSIRVGKEKCVEGRRAREEHSLNEYICVQFGVGKERCVKGYRTRKHYLKTNIYIQSAFVKAYIAITCGEQCKIKNEYKCIQFGCYKMKEMLFQCRNKRGTK